ncbi:MAG: glycosyltransferase [Bacteroidia bacterium]|nr:glycosyltransferase [Bacteroidia bacterium]
MPKYSIIVPVYNRPQEVEELLESLTKQTFKYFEVLLVEDGSSITSEKVFEKYAGKLNVRYFFKPNTGPGPSRNFGFEKARGEYFVLFDSDCIIPPKYFEEVEIFLTRTPLQAWGGPDKGHEDFTAVQRAMAYTMSSTLTTGGIRGGVTKGFQPRSFNMGISKEVFQQTRGFRFDRYAEDIELSIRIRKAGFKTGLIPEAYVFHKRRTDFRQFYHQVFNFGRGRVLVGRAHSGEVKPTHWFPAFFLIGMLSLPFLFIFNSTVAMVGLATYIFYLSLILLGCSLTTRSILVGLLSVPAACIQLVGYGHGFLKEMARARI